MVLKGKSLIVTGAASGIGQGIAITAAAAGAWVVCADIRDANATVARIVDSGGIALAKEMDVRQASCWAEVVDGVARDFGKLDLLANIAGIVSQHGPDTVVDVSMEHWNDIIATNLTGVWLGMKHAIPRMVEAGGGRIVNISSLAALRGLPNLAAYSASKGGVAALTRQAAVEYATKNVLINAIAPGTVNTPLLKNASQARLEAFTQAHAIKRLGTPDDIASMAMHFFSPEAGSWLTGAVMPVDGGWHAT
jgi:NAD(P)-dependent dehydrogenase (short-subunit alcohol dehydrogenase family)